MTIQEFENQEKIFKIKAWNFIAEAIYSFRQMNFLTSNQYLNTWDLYHEHDRSYLYEDYSDCPCCTGPRYEYDDGYTLFDTWDDLEIEPLYAATNRDKARNRYYINVKKKRDHGLRSYKRKNG